jgi:fimbrial chaperone protein
MGSRLLAVVVASVLLGRASTARCAEVQVNPVRVSLSPAARSEIVALRNNGAEPASFEMQIRSWEQSSSGEMNLGLTEDVVVFPPVVLLAPGEERNVRVGASISFGAVERTYRLFIQELPPPPRQETAPQVRVLTRIGIPVFLSPARVVERAVLKALSVRDGKVLFTLVNSGTVHVRPTAVKVALKDAQGKTLGNREAAAWYVLAGGERAYDVDLRGEGCAAVREVSVAITLDSKQVLQAASAAPEGVCAP